MADFTELIRTAVANNNYRISHHARQKRGKRRLTFREITTAITNGEIVEAHPQDSRGPKCLFMHPVRPNRPLYVSCGWDGSQAVIITAHWRDPGRWHDWRRRIKK